MTEDRQSELPDFPSPHGNKEAIGTRHATWQLPQLGLTTDHRRLFGGLATGWLCPLEDRATQVLRVSGFARESIPPPDEHRIAVRLCVDLRKLPDLKVSVLRNGQWVVAAHLDDLQPDDAVFWPGAIPAFAISSAAVPSSEEKDRLIGMSRLLQNVDLSDVEITVVGAMDDPVFPTAPPCETATKLTTSPEQDAIQGALTMAVWAVPRIDPWLDVLRASVGPDRKALEASSAALDARWWRLPPWRRRSECVDTFDDCLWLAALDVFQGDGHQQQRSRPHDLLDRIVMEAEARGGRPVGGIISAWQESTVRILSADAQVQSQGWRENPVGLAIQLVLTRPRPDRFKTWFKDKPDLPPGVAWSAATLCGLLNGYSRLPSDVRGCALQQELVAIEALSVASPQSASMRWPNGRLDLSWRRESSGFVLSHLSKDLPPKTQHARGRWYTAAFGEAAVRREARSVAQKLTWPCFRFPRSSPVAAPFADTDERGRGSLYSHEQGTFDVDAFRWLVAVEGGAVPIPTTASEPADVPGLDYVSNFLDEGDERHLVDWIDEQEWSYELKRRVQHYGWRYDYKAREVGPSDWIGDLPPPLAELAQRLYDGKLVPHMPDQVIVNEYAAGQGISRHYDALRSFADGIATISLLESWQMTFHAPGKGSGRSVQQLLERRSVAVMRGDARRKWKHEIVKRQTDPYVDENGRNRKRKRNRRLSLTFRKVLTGRKPDSSR